MTPKEKAEELIRAHYKYSDVSSPRFYAIRSAHITVNELINHCSQVEPYLGVDYWNEVKVELNNAKSR